MPQSFFPRMKSSSQRARAHRQRGRVRMGRSVFSHFLNLSNHSPRFAATTIGYRLQTRRSYSKRSGGIAPLGLPNRYTASVRCLCTVSATQSDVSEAPPSSIKKRVVSGVQPTGSIHLGNYLGAIKNWTLLQNTYETLFFIVDLHAGDENVGVALLTYPVLMASDILLYQTDLVPVGEDQTQHLELTRELAERVNYLFGGKKWKKMGGRGGALFKVPEALIPPSGARVMSLTDGLSKMSKSAPSDLSRINLLDAKDVIANKIKRCKTDSFPGLEFDNPDRPESNNLLSIYQLVTGKTKEEVTQECKDMNWGTFKINLTDALINHLHPIQVRYEEITSDAPYLDKVLLEGATKAAEIADATLNNVYQAMGFLRR
ncbi:tryptophan--tRNA ligase, chloroplastic/mitochondrial isoform X2 [Magnolia sinica]|uniref:tryptophan--tRNA ligase, chloroplastic/mitochondrial isoform X2 n=1 Tax=Magnolia sinica TaxID=86752 RepID=UPI0026583D24|nr:tryptophan--tRNA ligase, chloroplastic/mitochondrial isoform X2 [Magnolia sinica]